MNKSFTLIEILVVIVVIGVLSAFILVGMSSITSSANIAKSQAFVNSMDNSLLLARVSQWKLDEVVGSTTANDSWGTNTGTLSGTAPLAQFQTSGCPSNNCLSFDGTDDYVNCGNASDFNVTTGNFSVVAWVNPRTISGQFAVGKGSTGTRQWRLQQWNGYWEFIAADSVGGTSSGTADPLVKINTWYHIVGIKSGTKLYFYFNGVLQTRTGTLTGDSNVNAADKSVNIGRTNEGFYFNGLIDDVRFYNQAIPTSEIQQNYYLGLNNLYKNNGITLNEFNQRLAQLKNNLVKR